jgi:membrane protease YdiL (CAAX protease family)
MPTLVQEILLWCLVVLLYLGVAAAAWYAVRRLLLPPPQPRAAPWTALEVVIVFILLYALWRPCFMQLLVGTSLGERFYGPSVAAAARDGDKEALTRIGLLATILAFPFEVWSVLGILRFGSGTRPSQIGLTSHQAGRNMLLGVLGWLILTPPVLGLNGLVTWLFSLGKSPGNIDHPLTRLSRDPAVTTAELALLVLVAVVAAAVVEELLFRGMLQPWLARFGWGGYAGLGLALLAASLFTASQLPTARGWTERLLALAPVLFVLGMAPGCVWLARRTPAAAAVYGTSLFFAAVHSFAWPSPVALFVLALGLGWLAQRTGSLVGPMVLHGLFNAVSCVELLLQRSGLA